MRRFLVAVAVLAALVSATPVLAAPGCSAAYDLLSIDDTIDRVDERIYTPAEFAEIEALVASVDANQDGWLCSKQFVTNQGRDKQWIGPEDGDISDYVVTQVNDNKSNGHGS
jgi:hypothetical protein